MEEPVIPMERIDEMDSVRDNYQRLNFSYQRQVCFGVGIHAGFFSEINLMVLAMVYCLQNRLRFSMHSSNANFRLEKGWVDYFKPFCADLQSIWLDELDKRYRTSYPFVLTKPKRIYRGLWYSFKVFALKKRLNIRYLTFDLLDKVLTRDLETHTYTIPQLGIHGDLRSACHVISNLIWNFNSDVQRNVASCLAGLNLPEDYIGFQIRRGDKFQEAPLIQAEAYFHTAIKHSTIRNAFVFTDDFGVIEELSATFPEWRIYTLCKPDERGYTHQQFYSNDRGVIYNQTVKLLANIEILRKSQLFIGTFSANPSLFLGMIMDREKTISLDIPWQVWDGKPL